MHFILLEDVETDKHYPWGDLLSLAEYQHLVSQCGIAKAIGFPSLDAALEYNRTSEIL